MTAIITCRNAEHEVNDVDMVNDCIPCIPTTIPGQQSALPSSWLVFGFGHSDFGLDLCIVASIALLAVKPGQALEETRLGASPQNFPDSENGSSPFVAWRE